MNTPTSIMLVSGCYFDYLSPDPAVITLEVLEHGMQQPRFNNQTIRPISIAEHSLRAMRFAAELAACSGSRLQAEVELLALLHDAHEPLMPWGDCLRPGKTPEMRVQERRVDAAVREAFRIPEWSTDASRIVKVADDLCLYFEALLWQPGALDWAPRTWDDAERRRNPPHSPADMLPRSLFETMLPLVAPRPNESWSSAVEKSLQRCLTLRSTPGNDLQPPEVPAS